MIYTSAKHKSVLEVTSGVLLWPCRSQCVARALGRGLRLITRCAPQPCVFGTDRCRLTGPHPTQLHTDQNLRLCSTVLPLSPGF